MATQTEALSAFEIEVIRLLKETNNILTENQVLMKENKAQFTEMNEKLRKLLLNTN